jgi:hypothetical protein
VLFPAGWDATWLQLTTTSPPTPQTAPSSQFGFTFAAAPVNESNA